jgi:hypothetical protein
VCAYSNDCLANERKSVFDFIPLKTDPPPRH